MFSYCFGVRSDYGEGKALQYWQGVGPSSKYVSIDLVVSDTGQSVNMQMVDDGGLSQARNDLMYGVVNRYLNTCNDTTHPF